MRRVVLTGMGILTPLGLDAASFYSGLVRGQSAVRRLKSFDPAVLPTQIGAEITGFDVKKHVSKEERKQIRVMARVVQLAVGAADLAMTDSRIDKKTLDPTRFGIEFGAGLIPSELDDLGQASFLATDEGRQPVDLKIWGEQGLANINPLWMLKYLPNMLACHVSILNNAQGPNNTITESDVAGLLALGEARRIIQRNQSDVFLVGGADCKITPMSMIRLMTFGKLTRSNDAPEKAVKPFDLRRDGHVMGEGACVFVAEELEHARRRGATIHGEMAGFAAAFDRGLTGKGLARAIRLALADAGITPADVDHVNAHAQGSVQLDAFEACAIHEVFGTSVPVWTLKPAIGSLAAGAGTVELAASLLALKNGTLPPTLNYEVPDPACPVRVETTPQPTRKPYVVKIGYTELGQCAVVVCRVGGE